MDHTFNWWRVAAWLLALGLSGCAVTGPPEPRWDDPAVPLVWQGLTGVGPATAAPMSAATPLARWWLRFQDPMLFTLVDRALLANTSVSTARAALRQARALRDGAAAGLWPTLSVGASAQRNHSGDQGAQNALRVGVDASWEIDVFGGQRQALKAGDAEVVASAASLGDLQVSIAAEVALAYLTLRSGQARLVLARDNLESQRHTLQIVEWRQQAGLVGSLDVEQARSAAELTRAVLPALETANTQSRHALAVLCGLPPAALEQALAPGVSLPRAADDLVVGIPAETLRQRPDIRAAEWQLRAAAARVSQAQAARLPSLSLGFTLGLGAATLSAFGDSAALTRSLLASIALPLLDGGARSAQVRAQQAAQEQLHESWRAAVLRALQEVEDALAALQGDRLRTLHLGYAATAAGKAAQWALQSYRSGLVDYQRVLETQRSLLATQDNLASAEASFSANQVRLYKALGGGWGDDVLAGDLAANTPRTIRPMLPSSPP
jgi:NodT family efflux transporter outer membrane factor (OMF) lipoprotein